MGQNNIITLGRHLDYFVIINLWGQVGQNEKSALCRQLGFLDKKYSTWTNRAE